MAGKQVLLYLPAESLSRDAATRFKQLFRVRPSWPHEQLAPYLADLVGHGRTEASLLLKFTRVATTGGTRLYHPRW